MADGVNYQLPGEALKPGLSREIKVHEGMMYAADSLGEYIAPILKSVFFPSEFKVVIVGHSLG